MTATTDLMDGFKALNGAEAAYVRAMAYARGEVPEHFATERLRQLIAATSKAYKFRFVKIPITTIANRCQISSVVAGTDELNARIEAIRVANDMEKQEPFLMREMFTYGDAYALVWPVDPEEFEQRDGEPVDVNASAALRAAGIEITYQTPLACRAVYDSEDGRRVRFVVRRHREDAALGKVWRLELWYTDRIEFWVSKPGSSGEDKQEWEPYAEDADGVPVPVNRDNWPLPHDWGEIAIKHARNDLPYGRPEHIDGYGPQDAITKAVITQVTGIEGYGWQERWRIMDDAAMIDTSRDAVNWSDDAQAPAVPSGATITTETTGVRRGPGTETQYHGTKAVGQFPAPDPGALMDPIEQWVRHMATVTETPLYEFDPRTGEQMSGIARVRADAPLLAKERDRKRFLLGFWREVWRLALRMDGVNEPPPVDINWTPPEVVTDPEWWAVARQRMEMGVPLQVILQEANYPPEDVAGWLDSQGEETTLDARIDRVQRLGDALQSLGAAQALGVADEAKVQALIVRIMGEAA